MHEVRVVVAKLPVNVNHISVLPQLGARRHVVVNAIRRGDWPSGIRADVEHVEGGIAYHVLAEVEQLCGILRMEPGARLQAVRIICEGLRWVESERAHLPVNPEEPNRLVPDSHPDAIPESKGEGHGTIWRKISRKE